MGTQTRGPGRPQTNEYPRPIGPKRRPGRQQRISMLSQAETPPQNQLSETNIPARTYLMNYRNQALISN